MPIIRNCLVCGKEFKTKPSYIKKGWGKYCSYKCAKKEENHPMWKGDKVGYCGLHKWIERQLGKPRKCSECGTTTAKKYDWANISGEYRRDINDFKRLCVKCHIALDYKTRARGEKKGASKLTEKEVIKIRKLYVPREYTLRKLAKEFSVCQRTIFTIVKNIAWRHI